MTELFSYSYIQTAIAASVLASIAFGIIGTYVVVKRIVFISGGISHTAYGGIGLGILLGINPLWGAVFFALAAAAAISFFENRKKKDTDTLIGIMWAFGMALGIIFMDMSSGYKQDLSSYLFGNILTVPTEEIFLMLGLDILIIAITLFYYKEFKAITFDEEYAKTAGLPVSKLYLILLCLIALTIVILIKLVGIILVIAMISIPASISISYAKSIGGMMLRSILLGMFFSFAGIVLSFYLNLSTGAVIIIFSVLSYILSKLYIWKFKKQ